jgi:hypothetical protein
MKYRMEVIDVLVIGFQQPESIWWFGARLSLETKLGLAGPTWTYCDAL